MAIIGNWLFQNNANDSSGNNNDGVVTNATLTANRLDVSNYAYDFNGTSAYITCGTDEITTDTKGAIEIWFKIDTLATSYLVSSSDEATNQYFCGLRLDVSGRIGFYQDNGDTADWVETSSSVIDTSSWHHVIVQSTGTGYEVYHNGVKQALTTQGGSNNGDWFGDTSNRDNFIIGALKRDTVSDYVDGQIGSVTLYDDVLSLKEIRDNYGKNINLVGEWLFNGNAIDTSNKGNHGTVTNAVLTTDRFGNSNSAYDFNGTDAEITIPDSDVLTFGDGLNDVPFSINVWVNANDYDTFTIIDKCVADDNQSEYLFHFSASKQLIFSLFDSNTSNRIAIYDTNSYAKYEGKWTMYTATYDGSGTNTGMKLYTNGKEVSATNNNGGTYVAMENGSGVLHIGKRFSYSTNYSNGKIDDLKIYDRELSSREIEEIYGSRGVILDIPMLGNAKDLSGNGNDGTVNGATLTTDKDGRVNRAYSFNGTSDYIDCGSSVDLSGDYSISLWFEAYNTSANATLAGEDDAGVTDSVRIRHASDDTILYSHAETGGSSNTITSSGTYTSGWHHVVATFENGVGSKLYINGELEGSDSTQTSAINPSVPFWIGARYYNGGTGSHFYGNKIGPVKVWNKVLTAEEIRQDYLEISSDYESLFTDCIGYWDMSKDAQDVVGSNNGTVTSATLTTDHLGVEDSAYNFVASNSSDIINLNISAITVPVTFNVWFNPNSLQAGMILCNWNSTTKDFFLETNADGTFFVSVDGLGALTNTGSYSASEWSMLTVVLDTVNGVQFYKDGIFIDSSLTGTNTDLNSGSNYSLGTRISSPTRYFDGKISTTTIWEKALTATEVKILYDLTKTKKIYPFMRSGRE